MNDPVSLNLLSCLTDFAVRIDADGIIQQVITRINAFFPASHLRGIAEVLRDLEK